MVKNGKFKSHYFSVNKRDYKKTGLRQLRLSVKTRYSDMMAPSRYPSAEIHQIRYEPTSMLRSLRSYLQCLAQANLSQLFLI